MTILIALMLFVWIVATTLTLWSAWLARKHLRTLPPHLDAPFALYPVSILKPLKGADDGLEENLESFFLQNYPHFELLFSVADARDPARPVVEKLIKKFPKVQARLVIGAVDIGPNPKVNNMVHTYEMAQYDWLLISDSNVRVPVDYVKRLVAHLEPNVGIVTAIVAGQRPIGVGGYLEATYLNTFYARGMVLADRVGRPCVIGKTMLFRRSVAARFGGIRVLGRYLAEDYMAGEAMRKLGLRVVIANEPVDQQIGKHSFQAFWDRHLRWGRIRKAQAPLTFAIEPPLSCLASGIIGAFAMRAGFGVSPAVFLMLHLAVWAAADLTVIHSLQCKLSFQIPLAWFAREILSLPLWIAIASGNTVKWRGKKLVLQPGGILQTQNQAL